MDTLIAILPPEHEYARRILRGARNATARDGRFAFRKLDPSHVDDLPAMIRRERSVGILAFASQERLESLVLEQDIPAVNVSARLARSRLPRVTVDNQAVGRAAAEDLLDRGFTRQVFAGHPALSFSADRCAGWEAVLSKAGAEADTTNYRRYDPQVNWLADLPKPLGIVGCFDALRRDLMNRVIEAGVAVPEEMAFLGIDDSGDICEGGPVPLSSVETNGEGVRRAEL